MKRRKLAQGVGLAVAIAAGLLLCAAILRSCRDDDRAVCTLVKLRYWPVFYLISK